MPLYTCYRSQTSGTIHIVENMPGKLYVAVRTRWYYTDFVQIHAHNADEARADYIAWLYDDEAPHLPAQRG